MRRPTNLYLPKDCPKWNKFQNVKSYEEGGCPDGIHCKFAHGWKELDYHKDVFRTRQCNEGMKCPFKNIDCPFYHCKKDRIKKNCLDHNISTKNLT